MYTVQQAATKLATIDTEVASLKDQQINIIAEASESNGYTAAMLDKDGVGYKFNRDVWAQYKGVAPEAVPAPDLSKLNTWAHPKVRGDLAGLRTQAALAIEAFPALKLRKENAMYTLATHVKAGASMAEAQSLAAPKWREKVVAKLAAAPSDSAEGLLKSLNAKVAGKAMKAAFTEVSLSTLKSAIDGLEALPVSTVETEATPEPAQETAPAAPAGLEDVMAALAGSDIGKTLLAALVAAK